MSDLSNISEISPEAFEKLVKSHLLDNGSVLEGLKVKHNTRIRAYDGGYQIDVKANFRAFKTNILVLIECKHYQRPIERDEVIVLNGKLTSIGAHKGIIFSTSGFQSGAIKYARVHGIALIAVYKEGISYIVSEPGYQPSSIQNGLESYSFKIINPINREYTLHNNLQSLIDFLFKDSGPLITQ